MRQIFPAAPDDDVDVRALYASEERARPDRPWVTMNMISSVDGGISIDGVSGGLGGPGDKAVFSALRGMADVILVASGTVIAENYRKPQTPESLQTVRAASGQDPIPRIAIVSNSLSIAPDHRVFDSDHRPLMITHRGADAERRQALAEVADLVDAGDDAVDLRSALDALYALGARTVLCEGGPSLNGALVAEDLVDEVCLSFSPILLGGDGPRITRGPELPGALTLSLQRVLQDENFLFFRYVRR
ncbi:MAG: dihydrofolate reductase family protein [Acidimicrobiia bacterium]|nr:dihydrofolate reductase family protein [Acidimicrobiia bacterium]